MKYKITNTAYLYTLLFFILLLVATPLVVWGQDFTPLVGIPGLSAESSIGDYVNALYILSISIAAFLAVIKLILAGVKYMTSDIVTLKEEAKKDIKGALFGLLIVIGAVLILSTINSQLTGFNILESDPNLRTFGDGEGSGITEDARVRTETCTSAIGVRLDCAYFIEKCQARDGYISHQVDEERGIVICYTRSDDDIERDRLENERLAKEAECRSRRGNPIRRSDGTIDCLGGVGSGPSADNILNNIGLFQNYLDSVDLGVFEEEELLRQYNQFVMDMEPDNLDLNAVEAEFVDSMGANEVLFVVTKDVGSLDQHISLCRRITGSDNFIIGTNYNACVK